MTFLKSGRAIIALSMALAVTGCQNQPTNQPISDLPPNLSQPMEPPRAGGRLGNSNETVSGLTSEECFRRMDAGTVDGEACLEPGI
jgi:hypothetical protein